MSSLDTVAALLNEIIYEIDPVFLGSKADDWRKRAMEARNFEDDYRLLHEQAGDLYVAVAGLQQNIATEHECNTPPSGFCPTCSDMRQVQEAMDKLRPIMGEWYPRVD